MIKVTFRQKWENYWYYYKIHTITGIFILIVLLITLKDCASRVDPDFSALYVGDKYFNSEALEAEIEEFVGDLNGDGENSLFFEQILIPENPQSEMDLQMHQKLLLTFVSRDARLYIIEDQFLERYGDSFESLEGILPPEKLEGGKEFDGKVIGIPASNCEFLKKHGLSDSDLYVGILLVSADDQRKPNIDALYNASVEVLRFIAE